MFEINEQEDVNFSSKLPSEFTIEYGFNYKTTPFLELLKKFQRLHCSFGSVVLKFLLKNVLLLYNYIISGFIFFSKDKWRKSTYLHILSQIQCQLQCFYILRTFNIRYINCQKPQAYINIVSTMSVLFKHNPKIKLAKSSFVLSITQDEDKKIFNGNHYVILMRIKLVRLYWGAIW